MSDHTDLPLLETEYYSVCTRLDEAHAEIDRLRHELDEARAENERLTNALTNARAVSDDRIADREAALRDIMRERDEARGEVERLRDLGQQLCAAIGVPDAVDPIEWARDLRAEIQQLRAEPAGYMHASTGEVFEAEDLVVITPDGPAAIADTTCHGASSCRSPVHFDSCLSETPGERIPDHRDALVERVQVFYDDDTHSEVIEAPRAQRPTEETR